MSDSLELLRRDHEAFKMTTERHIGTLSDDIAEIKRGLENVATRKDIADLHQHVDHSVNSLLRDALQSVPGRQSLLWGAIVAIATVGTLVLKFLEHHG